MTFERVCALSDLEPETVAQAIVGGRKVAMVRAEDGSVHAVQDECSHQDVSLSEGEVEDCSIECWLHGSTFDLRTGEPQSLPATEPIEVYSVRVDGEDVYVSLAPQDSLTTTNRKS